jgi:uncharacterized membrane protein
MTDLIKCSRCQCKKLPDLFKVRANTGLRLKTCIQCCNRFKCSQCEYACCSNSDLKKHIKQVHDKIKDIECDKCKYKCSENSNLQKHIKQVHDKIKDIECDKCKYKCSSNSNLQMHIKMIHDKIKDFECDKCKYKCSSNSNLQMHIKQVHDKIKDFECDKCKYKCSSNSSLQMHIKQVHDKIKDFECDKCKYKCSRNSSLKKHIKVCTGSFRGSKGEKMVSDYLIENEYSFHYDCSHDNLLSIFGNKLRFDFIIMIGDEIKMVEYDGKQHTEPVCFGGISQQQAKENLKTLQQNDRIKDQYCIRNNISMLRISYIDRESIPVLLEEFLKC